MSKLESPSSGSWDLLNGIYPITSGSAVIPDGESNFSQNILGYQNIIGNSPQEFQGQLNEIIITNLKIQSMQDEKRFIMQKRYGLVIFITGMILVAIGLIFSAIQLFTAIKINNYDQLTTVVSWESGSLNISSSVIGIFVLLASIIFFILFLKYIYTPNNRSRDIIKKIITLREK